MRINDGIIVVQIIHTSEWNVTQVAKEMSVPIRQSMVTGFVQSLCDVKYQNAQLIIVIESRRMLFLDLFRRTFMRLVVGR